ncbi:hypothetical protein D8674_012420 [Pyrus ussuriensis x Pyrus communis]|uniref:Uncharacterized protein n=1 Tax=Pyrus ussuriensis x Pyrus communis TaxID=2448454 RepID=A0A5N5G775_9ROSA|nr:hypothetical protein D8674_012420 [Pyrus ussuriensis x Pyrus communis]
MDASMTWCCGQFSNLCNRPKYPETESAQSDSHLLSSPPSPQKSLIDNTSRSISYSSAFSGAPKPFSSAGLQLSFLIHLVPVASGIVARVALESSWFPVRKQSAAFVRLDCAMLKEIEAGVTPGGEGRGEMILFVSESNQKTRYCSALPLPPDVSKATAAAE